ncbi:MAG TPA: DUF6504 family protein [Trebonia sp.]
MGRVYSERVDVRTGEDGRPARFVWRSRLYTVREVTEHWMVNREWWREPAVLPRTVLPETELRYYMVEASAGQYLSSGAYANGAYANGAYELREDVAAGTWTLCRVAD